MLKAGKGSARGGAGPPRLQRGLKSPVAPKPRKIHGFESLGAQNHGKDMVLRSSGPGDLALAASGLENSREASFETLGARKPRKSHSFGRLRRRKAKKNMRFCSLPRTCPPSPQEASESHLTSLGRKVARARGFYMQNLHFSEGAAPRALLA